VLFEQILFFFAAFLAIAGALGVVLLRNPFFSVLALVAHLIALATLFLLLRAEFIAAAQVVVYAGAVMVLYVFVVAYIGGVDEPLGGSRGVVSTLGPVFAAFLLVEITIAVLGTGLGAIDSRGADVPVGFGSPAAVGQLLLTRFLVPFEGASFLLLVGAVGAVVLARRRRGLEHLDPDTAPERAGTMPLGDRGGDEGLKADPDHITPIPSSTAEGVGDPTVAAGERT
jgi:NADH-quinone oxidoreductase subunit J